MAIDMTIIGTNAIVAAHRFGSRGAALSVIAQHLRSHALLVDDEVARIKPILTDVLKSGKRFASGRRMQNGSSMGEMAIGITEALIAFKAADAAVSDVRARLRIDVTSVDEILRQSAAAFADIDRVRLTLADAGATARQWASDAGAVDEDGEPALGELLRSRYTMQSEREVYDLFKADHGGTPAAASPTMIGDVDDFFF